MKNLLKTLFILVACLYLSACSSKGINGLGKGLYMGNNRDTVEKTFENIESEDTYIKVADVTAFNDKYTGEYFISFDENNELNYISFSFDSTSGESAEDIINLLTEMYGEPVHLENYKNQKSDTATIAWYVDDNTYAYIRIYTNSEKTYSVQYYPRELENETDAQKKYENITNVISKDSELKSFYEFLLSRSNMRDGSIETAITLYDAKYNGKSIFGDLEFIDSTNIFGIEFKSQYGVNNPYSSDSKNDDFKGQIDSLSIDFDNSDSSTNLVLEKLTQLFGECVETINDDTKEYKWEDNLPFIVSLTTRVDKKYDNHIFVSENLSYYHLNPDFAYDNSVESIAPYKNVDDTLLYGESGYIGGVGVDSDKGKEITNFATNFILNCLKYPDGAEVTVSEIFKATDSTYNVKGTFKAQNAFGVFSTDSFNIYISDENGYIKLSFGEIAGQLF